jgi:hypothetical protein
MTTDDPVDGVRLRPIQEVDLDDLCRTVTDPETAGEAYESEPDAACRG